VAAEDQRDDDAREVLVDAGEPVRLSSQARLLAHLPPELSTPPEN
jgi:hypothetical protein